MIIPCCDATILYYTYICTNIKGTLTGGMSRSQRSKALSDFQKDPPTTVFLLSTRAGNADSTI